MVDAALAQLQEVLRQRDKARAEVERLQSQFDAAQASIDRLGQDCTEFEAEVERLIEVLRKAGGELEAGNDRGAKHIIQDAIEQIP